MLISSNSERQKRHQEKMEKLLSFLKEETYSDFKTIKLFLNFKDYKSIYQLLAKLEAMGLVQKYVFESRVGSLALWGITQDGIAVVIQPGDQVFPSRFEPAKLRGWTLDHHLDNQLVHLILEQKGATGWINGDRNTFLNQFQVKHRPDGLITLPNGKRIAVETERSLKTKARYQQIIQSHLAARTSELWFNVFYVLPDEQKKRALMLLFDNIKYVLVNGQPVTLEAKHRRVFRFFTMDELQELDLNENA